MKLRISIAVAAMLFAQAFADAGDDKAIQALEAERAKLAKRLAELDAELARLKGVFRYLLPAQDLADKKSTADKWGLAAPIVDDFSDPNGIVYDQTYVEKYIAWAVDTPIVCGAGTYWIATPDNVIEVKSGLDESYLGRRFRAEDLMTFLKTRVDGKTVERSFRVNRPDALHLASIR